MKVTRPEEIDAILEGFLVAATATTDAGEAHTRYQDDTDGEMERDDTITVLQSIDGDMWISQGALPLIRFRTVTGGGFSPRTHNALRILARAIELDNKHKPQVR